LKRASGSGHPRREPATRHPLQCSVVIPAFNEAARLPRYLEEVVSYLGTRGEPWEVLVVDDGSTDGTAEVARAMGARCPQVRLVRQPVNAGKGAAVRAGMLAARGDFRLFTDADGATPITELKRLEPALLAGADAAIGSRVLFDPAVSVHARRHRVAAGRVFNWLVARLGLRGVADSQCGFKAFQASAAQRLFGALQTRGFGFDVELLLRAQAAGDRVVEVAVNWADQAGSKVGVLRTSPGMLVQILLARLRVGGAR
jgi:dolichyl-phosphate beta-glucosyltransferase